MLLDFCGFLYCIFALHFPSLRPCILSTLSIHYAYISSVLTVSFNGIKQIQQLYQFLHIHLNTLISLIEAIYYMIAMPSVQSFQSVLYFLLQFHWNIPTVFFHFNDAINLISFHQFLQFHQFLSISFNSMSFIDSVNTSLSIPSIQFQLLHQIHQYHYLYCFKPPNPAIPSNYSIPSTTINQSIQQMKSILSIIFAP